jgi:hypothetical protein
MKCVKLTNSNKVVRCEDKYANILIQKGIGVYTNKEKWKADGRNYLTKQDEQLLKGVKKSEY